MDNKVGFYFTTDSGNRYFYDDNNGSVTLTDSHDDIDFIYDENSEVDNEFNVDADEIDTYLKYNGYNQMMLVVTEKCNLRCKYCIYSGNYDNQREHGINIMSFETAKRAIDMFYETQKIKIKNNALHLPLLGFYGGEPLMNFKLVKECVDYARELFDNNINFLATTNGTIMNEEIADFLINNNFALSVSLNGNKKENDRLRVFCDGSGTFETIMKNISFLRERNFDYFKKNVKFIGCYDWKSDLDSINDFCKQNEYDIPEIVKISMVNDTFTDWYKQFTDQEKKEFFAYKKEIQKKITDNLKNGRPLEPIERLLYADSIMEVVNRIVNIPVSQIRPSFSPISGTCIPGTKLCVAPDGKIHSCEKINNTRPIGNVYDGVDMQAIADMLTAYYKKLAPVCSKCPVKRLCPICFTSCLGDDGEFTRSQIKNCEQVRKSMREKFTFVFNLLEAGISEEQLLDINKRGK
ncbi:MAG: radical SAM protein [Oscillospiraceae bacterium]|nr:radical SAM protein [Oscillospiraceae bacterium]MBQ9981940.1 radical SAM protein [Oscillospiraceae bacterium]